MLWREPWYRQLTDTRTVNGMATRKHHYTEENRTTAGPFPQEYALRSLTQSAFLKQALVELRPWLARGGGRANWNVPKP